MKIILFLSTFFICSITYADVCFEKIRSSVTSYNGNQSFILCAKSTIKNNDGSIFIESPYAKISTSVLTNKIKLASNISNNKIKFSQNLNKDLCLSLGYSNFISATVDYFILPNKIIDLSESNEYLIIRDAKFAIKNPFNGSVDLYIENLKCN